MITTKRTTKRNDLDDFYAKAQRQSVAAIYVMLGIGLALIIVCMFTLPPPAK